MTRRSCANCGVSDWVDYRWCRDCWRMVAKVVVTQVIAALVSMLAALIFGG